MIITGTGLILDYLVPFLDESDSPGATVVKWGLSLKSCLMLTLTNDTNQHSDDDYSLLLLVLCRSQCV